MANKIYKTDEHGGRTYRYPGHRGNYPGVTRIIGTTWPSGGLEQWKMWNLARRFIANGDSMQKFLQSVEKIPNAFRDADIKHIQTVFSEWREDYTAANRGTRIHQGVEDYFKGKKKKQLRKEMSPDEYPAVATAIDALERLRMTPEYLEVPAFRFDPKYAGTIDMIVKYTRLHHGKEHTYRAVVDLKTGKRINRSYAPQVAAYAMADEIWVNEEFIPMPAVSSAFILHVSANKGDFYRINLHNGWKDFEACYRIYQAANNPGSLWKYGD